MRLAPLRRRPRGITAALGSAMVLAALALAAPGFVAPGLIGGLAFAAPAAPAAVPAALEVPLGGFAGTYSQPGADLGAMRQGPMTVHLVSPENTFDLLAAGLRLTPLADGSHRAEVTLSFRGEGRLVADLDLGGAPARLEDRVVVPQQLVAVEARVRLTPGTGAYAGAYEVTPLELPESVPVVIESALLGRLAAACRPLALLALAPVDCAGVERALSRTRVPLPAVGETYLLPRSRLGAAEQRRLDAYLVATPTTAPATPAAQGSR